MLGSACGYGQTGSEAPDRDRRPLEREYLGETRLSGRTIEFAACYEACDGYLALVIDRRTNRHQVAGRRFTRAWPLHSLLMDER